MSQNFLSLKSLIFILIPIFREKSVDFSNHWIFIHLLVLKIQVIKS